jgi:hypothetical protein
MKNILNALRKVTCGTIAAAAILYSLAVSLAALYFMSSGC